HAVGKCRGLFAMEVSSQPMPDRLVQENARPPRAQDHCHRPGGGVSGAQIEDRLPRRLLGVVFPSTFLKEESELGAAATAIRPHLPLALFLRNAGDLQT